LLGGAGPAPEAPAAYAASLVPADDPWNRARRALVSASRPTPPQTWESAGSAWTVRRRMISDDDGSDDRQAGTGGRGARSGLLRDAPARDPQRPL